MVVIVRRARVVRGKDWKPIVISRADSSPADDAMYNMIKGLLQTQATLCRLRFLY